MIYVENKKRKIERIYKEYSISTIYDVTSTSPSDGRYLSPFYPHGGIPIPYTDRITAASVESVWQGLKVFENKDVDFCDFDNVTMKHIKRSVRVNGRLLGHRQGAYGTVLLNYFDARMQIYLPTYKWMLDNISKAHKVINDIIESGKTRDIVLLDYNTNKDFRDISKPLSHAGLIKLYIEGNYPDVNDSYIPMSNEEINQKRLDEKAGRKKIRSKRNCVNQDAPCLFDLANSNY